MKISKYELYVYFYIIVDKIISDIINDETISNDLFKCKYLILNTNEETHLPLVLCLGGSAYIQYQNIFMNENLNYDINIRSYDYDISFSIYNNMNNEKIKIFSKKILDICNKNLNLFSYKNLNKNIFKVTYRKNNQRIHFRIDYNDFHILELSFWLNRKVSDNFTINDFKSPDPILYLYENHVSKQTYYLLTLKYLTKTTLYAIVDFFERRNFSKCIKYLNRMKYIKKINDEYNKLKVKPDISYTILECYVEFVKRKYKMINDYPFTISNNLVNERNNGIVKCIYRNLRINNSKTINTLIDKYKNNECKDKQIYETQDSETTPVNTEDE